MIPYLLQHNLNKKSGHLPLFLALTCFWFAWVIFCQVLGSCLNYKTCKSCLQDMNFYRPFLKIWSKRLATETARNGGTGVYYFQNIRMEHQIKNTDNLLTTRTRDYNRSSQTTVTAGKPNM